MPSSPVTVKLKDYPSRWKWKQKIIIPCEKTDCYFKIYYEQKGDDYAPDTWYAHLMWCPSDEQAQFEDNWGHVEEMTRELTDVLNTIEMVFDISFHDKIIEELPSE